MKYRSNLNIPKPSSLIESQKVLPTFYLEQGSTIQVSERCGYLRLNDQDMALENILGIIALAPIEIDGAALSMLMKNAIPVSLFSLGGELLGRIEPAHSMGNLPILQNQLTEEKKVRIVQAIAWTILRRVKKFFLRVARERATQSTKEILSKACKELQWPIDSVYKHDSVASLQGVIGNGMRIYYQTLPACLNNDWQFSSRSDDNCPLNRMLNFAEAILNESAKTAIYAAGLDPKIGYWHKTYYKQEGLVSDLSAEFFFLAHTVVLRLVNRNHIVPKDFNDCWEEKHLPVEVTNAIARSMQKKMSEQVTYPFTKLVCSYQEMLFLQAKQIGWYLNEEIDEYYSPDLR